VKFLVVLHKDNDSDYGVTVPDVPGCFSAGTSVGQALENVQKALVMHFEGLVADNEALPQAQAVEVHVANSDYKGGQWAFVELDLPPYLAA